MATQVTLGSGVVDSASGLKLRTNGTTEAVDISTGQVVTLAKDAVVNGLTVGKGAGAVSRNTVLGNLGALGNASLSGNDNVGVGSYVLQANTTGANNTVVGSQAAYSNTTGSANTAYGTGALNANTTASNNTAVGYQAGYTNTTGTYNTFVGYQAGYSSATVNSNTAFGFQALYKATGAQNNAFGESALYNITTGTLNTGIGYNAGVLMTTGSKNTIIGSYTGNQGGLDIRTASNYIVLSDGDGNPRLYIDNGPTLVCPAVYTITSANAANVVVLSSGSIVRSTSALKYKQDIRDVEDFDINLLRPVRYKSKCEGDDQTKDYLGLIADEAAEAGFEELVTRGADGEVEGFQYERLTVVLLKELQTLKAKVAALENK